MIRFQDDETEAYEPWFPRMLEVWPDDLETLAEIDYIMNLRLEQENEMGFVK